MTKTEFMEQLAAKLQVLPEATRQEALDIYAESLECGDSRAVISRHGSPGDIAAAVLSNHIAGKPLADLQSASVESSHKSGIKSAMYAVMAIFALPVALPISIALASVLLSLVLTLIVLVGVVCVMAVAFFVFGAVGVILMPIVFMSAGISSGLLVGGMGFASLGFCALAWISFTNLSKKGLAFATRFVGNVVLKRRRCHGKQ